MRLKDKILIAAVALLILTWLFQPMSESPRHYSRYRGEPPVKFDGFHFRFSNDPYVDHRVLKTDWSKLLMLNLVILGAGGAAYFPVSKKD